MFLPLRPALEAAEQQEACQLLRGGSKELIDKFERPMPGDCPLTGLLLPALPFPFVLLRPAACLPCCWWWRELHSLCCAALAPVT